MPGAGPHPQHRCDVEPTPTREREVVDDDEEDHTPEVASSTSPPTAEAAGGCTEELRVVWDSGSRSHPAVKQGAVQAKELQPSEEDRAAAALKDQGNVLFKAGHASDALRCYQQAAEALTARYLDGHITPAAASQLPQHRRHLLATLHSNAAAAALKLGDHTAAVAAALRAHTWRPDWGKPLHRVAEAQLAMGQCVAAVAACRRGEALCPVNSQGHTEFTPLLDRIAVEAAAAGSLDGYDGRQLEVRSAGEEAWLGRPAPHVPELDGPLNEDSALPSDDITLSNALAFPTPALTAGPATLHKGGATGAAVVPTSGGSSFKPTDHLASWDYRDSLEVARRARTSFRSVREAVQAARDGDRILLRQGVHNGMGECVEVGKRVVIMGEGPLGATVIDQRANCPTFRITRGGVALLNLDLDQTGFREAVLVCGGPTVRPLLDGCIIKCSGDDAINIAGDAHPVVRRCVVTGKKCGVRAFDAARGQLQECVLEKCGEQGVKVMQGSALTLTSCRIRDCTEEGAVAMDAAAITLRGCMITGNKGPGVDASGSAHVAASGGEVQGNVGGVWAWDAAKVGLEGVRVEGGPAQVILADGSAQVTAVSCTLKGSVHASDAAWQGLTHESNTFEDPDAATDFPLEEGPFQFVPNRFTRKQ